MGRDSSTSLAPGFRFHPTDEELVRYYLKRKVCGKPLRIDPITDVDIYRNEPWELPKMSKLKTRDLEWYFFSALDKKYGNSSRTNRATENGYWKTTGKDRSVRQGPRTVGMKKTLVYHSGRAPKGARTNWVMHEYRLEDEEMVRAGIAQDAFVLCRIFQKSGTGPKNGEQYGAPFIEEEWEDDAVAMVPGDEVLGEEVQNSEGFVDDCILFNPDELEQNFGTTLPSENAVFPPNYYHGDSGHYIVQPENFTEHNPSETAPLPSNFYHGETSNYARGDFSESDVKPMIRNETSELGNDQAFFEMPREEYGVNPQSVKDEYFVQPSNDGNPMDTNYSFGEQYPDATDHTQFSEQVQVATNYSPFGESVLDAFDEGLFLETNDLSKPIVVDPSDFDLVDEYLNFFDGDVITENLDFDSTQVMGTENAVTEQEPQRFVTAEAEVALEGSQQAVETHSKTDASSSDDKAEVTKSETDFKSPFLRRASQMLGSIPAPPAFAAEFPTKEAALRLNSAAQASSSAHVTAGMIRITNLNLDGNERDWSFGKNRDLDLFMSYYGLPETGLSGKASSVVRRGWFLYMFIWVLVISVSCKVGCYIYTRKCLGS